MSLYYQSRKYYSMDIYSMQVTIATLPRIHKSDGRRNARKRQLGVVIMSEEYFCRDKLVPILGRAYTQIV